MNAVKESSPIRGRRISDIPVRAKPMREYAMFKPWKGPQYETTRLLLLGESAYSWKEDGRLSQSEMSQDVQRLLLEPTLQNRIEEQSITGATANSFCRLAAPVLHRESISN